MLCERVLVPSSRGAQIKVDAYVPRPSREIDPDVRRPAVVICPGGGYAFCSEREAEPVALRFLAEGFNAFVVWYRVNGTDAAPRDHEAKAWYSASDSHVFPLPQHDAAAAVAHVRRHAAQYNTDPNRIAVLGFSAGGHLAASLAGLWHRAELWAELGLSPQDVRPDAAVLCYPVITADSDAHRGSFENLSGSKALAEHAKLDVLRWVDANFPPTFIWHTFSDPTVPVQNSLRLGLALANAHVPAEMHIFPSGTHGLSLANTLSGAPDRPELHVPDCTIWPELAAKFLRSL